MAVPQKNSLLKGVNLDLDELRLPNDTVQFIKNLASNANANAAAAAGAGNNEMVFTPIEGNQYLPITGSLPGGRNYCIGYYSSEQTNEGYFFLYNSNLDHSIWVVRGNTGAVEKVHQNPLLGFLLDPQYFVSEGRCTLELISFFNKVTNKQDNYKLLCFTINVGEPRCIDVESSIATTSFSTSYFTSSLPNYKPETLITLGVPLPIKCVKINSPVAYAPQPGDDKIQNLEIRHAWQFRIKTIDVFGRESEHGIISNQYITVIGGGCITASNGNPRCVNLNFDAGNPYVDYIQIEYRVWVDGNTPTEGEWQLYDTIAKWDNSGANLYYNRSINPALTYNVLTNAITYTFCADKGSTPLDPTETSRTEPEIPRWSSSIFSISKRLGLANNGRGFQPFDPSILSNISITAQDPSPSDVPCPSAPMRTIKFYLTCYQPVYGVLGWVDRLSYGQHVFGNSDGGDCASGSTMGSTRYISSLKLGQVFADQANPGFIAYAAGTDYKCIMQPGYLDPATGVWTPAAAGAYSQMAQGVLHVPAGKYVVRIASHKVKITDSNIQKTSTYVGGQCYVQSLATPAAIAVEYPAYTAKEMVFDCSAGDINANNPTDAVFVVLDLGDGVKGGAQDGYLYEQPGGNPIEMAPCSPGGLTPSGLVDDGWGSYWTDHNGFYFCASRSKPNMAVKLDFCDDHGPVSVRMDIFGPTSGTTAGAMQHGDGSSTPAGACYGEYGMWNQQIYVFPGGGFPESARRRIRQNFSTCADNTVGVPGILVVPRAGQPQISDGSGNIEAIMHYIYEYSSVFPVLPWNGAYVSTKFDIIAGQTYMIVSQRGVCQWNDCGGCNTFTSDIGEGYTDCQNIYNLPQKLLGTAGTNLYGIKSGARYPVGILGHDLLGRHCFVQKLGYVNSKNLNDVGYQQFALQHLAYSIAGGTTFPSWVKYLTFVVGADTISTDFISWQVDWLQLVDNTGATTATPTSIRIYYNSLNEYNKQYAFNTTTNWEFIGSNDQGSDTAPLQEGDIIQLIMNGNGQWFNSVKQGVVRYSREGNYILIDYDSGFVDAAGSFLMNGALFRVIRPVQFADNNVNYYEQCLTIELNDDGTVPNSLSGGVLPYFDSYLIQRQIPVPLLAGQTAPIPPGGIPSGAIQYTSTNDPATPNRNYADTNVANYNNVVSMSSTDAQTTFPFYFESPSASDFWGSHVANRGRIFVANEYERQRIIDTEIALSNPISDRGLLNGIGYFDIKNAQVFDRNVFGGITVVLVEMGVIMAICNNDYFIARYNQSQIQITAQGSLLGQNPEGSTFTAPQEKVGNNYGCVMGNINSIDRYSGTVVFLDIKGHLIFSDLSKAQPVEKSQYLGYLLNKIAYMNIQNQNTGANGFTYPVGKIDPNKMEYNLTFFNIPAGGGKPTYINTDDEPNISSNETLVFDLATGILKNSPSYTPEMFGRLPGFYLQRQFIAFNQGLPYIHHHNYESSVTPPPYANFFGVQCPVRVTLVVNGMEGKLLPDKVKRFLWTEVYTRQNIPGGSGVMPSALFFADSIESEKGQQSRLLIGRWDLKDGYQCAAYLCAVNTPPDPNMPVQTGAHAILDGDPLQGRWLRVSLVTNPGWNGDYFELSEIVNYFNGVEKTPE